jgi:ubiquinol-cytochrome c reductase cytochrome b subunit
VVVLAAFLTFILVLEGYRSPWSPDFVGKYTDQIPSLPTAAYANLSPQAQAGAKLMHTFGCLGCHRIAGTGKNSQGIGGQRGPDLSYVGDRLTENDLIWRILRGGGGMPAYGNVMKSTQLQELVAFLESRTVRVPQQASSETKSP